jgi:prepilin-type N-terminal cleavage/methylation domain-containing protein
MGHGSGRLWSKKHDTSQGFTLIELSLTLVIIGLIVGGVLVGQELIKSATVRKQIAEWEQVSTAVNTFKGKYNCLPGDCLTANTFFPGSSNGDGNGSIATSVAQGDVGNFSNGGNPAMERCHFWYHLSYAKLIAGTFPLCAWTVGVSSHTPPLLISNQFNYLVTASCSTPRCASIAFTGEHYIISKNMYNSDPAGYGEMNTGNNSPLNPAPYTVEDMRIVDAKIDDGNALTGKFQAYLYNSPFPPAYGGSITDLCTDVTTSDGYKNNYTARQCHFQLRTMF